MQRPLQAERSLAPLPMTQQRTSRHPTGRPRSRDLSSRLVTRLEDTDYADSADIYGAVIIKLEPEDR